MLRAAIAVVLTVAVSGAALAADDAQSTANFYAREGECRFEFYGNPARSSRSSGPVLTRGPSLTVLCSGHVRSAQ
jgi:hypothetical protein